MTGFTIIANFANNPPSFSKYIGHKLLSADVISKFKGMCGSLLLD